jgi:hypothetical protein
VIHCSRNVHILLTFRFPRIIRWFVVHTTFTLRSHFAFGTWIHSDHVHTAFTNRSHEICNDQSLCSHRVHKSFTAGFGLIWTRRIVFTLCSQVVHGGCDSAAFGSADPVCRLAERRCAPSHPGIQGSFAELFPEKRRSNPETEKSGT